MRKQLAIRISKTIIVVTIIILVLVDILLYVFGTVDATFSRVIYSASKEHPIIPFIAGGLAYHFFGRKTFIRNE